MKEVLDFSEILEVLKRNFKLILGITILGGLLSALVTFFLITPKYQATTQVLVSQSQNSEIITNVDIQASLQLVNTYSEIIKSPSVLDEVKRNLNLKYSSQILAEKIKVTSQNQSQVLNLVVTEDDHKQSVKIANELAEVFQKKIPSIMNVDNVSILTKAKLSESPKPVSPKPLLNILIGLALGTMIGLIYAYLKNTLDKRVTTDEDVHKYLDLPVIGTVMEFNK